MIPGVCPGSLLRSFLSDQECAIDPFSDREPRTLTLKCEVLQRGLTFYVKAQRLQMCAAVFDICLTDAIYHNFIYHETGLQGIR